MIKKTLATTAMAASVLGVSATAAPHAIADNGKHAAQIGGKSAQNIGATTAK